MISKGVRDIDRDQLRLTFKCLLDVDGLLGTGLEVGDVALGLAEGHGSFRNDRALVFFNINFVANNNLQRQLVLGGILTRPPSGTEAAKEKNPGGKRTYKWEALRVARARLNQKLIPPAVQGFETLCVVHVVDQNTAVGSSVESDTQ